MFKDVASVQKYFENWLLNEMGFYYKVEYCSCERIKKLDGDCVWKIDTLVPNSLFFVFCKSGDIEDREGYFNSGINKVFEANPVTSYFESEPE